MESVLMYGLDLRTCSISSSWSGNFQKGTSPIRKYKVYLSLIKVSNYLALWDLIEWQIFVMRIILNFQSNSMKLSRFWDLACTSTLIPSSFGMLIFTRSVVVKISMPKLDGISVDVRAWSQSQLNFIQLFRKSITKY